MLDFKNFVSVIARSAANLPATCAARDPHLYKTITQNKIKLVN